MFNSLRSRLYLNYYCSHSISNLFLIGFEVVDEEEGGEEEEDIRVYFS